MHQGKVSVWLLTSFMAIVPVSLKAMVCGIDLEMNVTIIPMMAAGKVSPSRIEVDDALEMAEQTEV